MSSRIPLSFTPHISPFRRHNSSPQLLSQYKPLLSLINDSNQLLLSLLPMFTPLIYLPSPASAFFQKCKFETTMTLLIILSGFPASAVKSTGILCIGYFTYTHIHIMCLYVQTYIYAHYMCVHICV